MKSTADHICWETIKSAESEYAICKDKSLKKIIVETEFAEFVGSEFVGDEVAKFAEPSIGVTCKHDTWTVNFILCDFNGRELIESAEVSEVGQMRSMIGYRDGRVIHGH
eukprot:6742658-Karenia_brevis.AAC.1